MASSIDIAPASPIQSVFQQRSGRVIALSRALLASFFTLAFALDPTQSDAWIEPALLLLSAYTLFAGVIFILTWKNWWLETRLAVPAHAVDLLVFAVLLALTEGYVSPFFTFFVFLVLSSAIRGGWREAMVTTAIVVFLFFASGLIATEAGGQGLDIRRFVVRGVHVTVLSFMIVWFGISQIGAQRARVSIQVGKEKDDDEDDGLSVRHALDHAVRRFNAGRAVLVWSESEEPWLHVDTLDSGTFTRAKFGPEDFPDIIDAAVADFPFLFDTRRRRLLFARNDRRQTIADSDMIDAAFSARFGIDAGIAVPIRTSAQDGHLFALAIPGLSADDLRLGALVGGEISSAFERDVLFAATRDAAATRARLALARDLHDSVVQFLAGMGLKLEGMKKVSNLPASVVEEIDILQHQLVAEQRDLRRLIAAWRHSSQPADSTSLADAIRTIAARLEQQWGLAFVLTLDGSLEAVPFRLHHDIEQLVREAAANAARHGRATRVTLAAAVSDGVLHLDIADDGCGFPVDGAFTDAAIRAGGVGPRSLTERVHLQQGSVTLSTSAQSGARLAITLPLEIKVR